MLVNLTPHPIVVYLEARDEVLFTLPSAGQARCEQRDEYAGLVNHDRFAVPVYRTTYGAVTGLPAPQQGVYYVVSALVAQAVRDQRDDLLVVAKTARDAEGRIIGCRGFARI